MLTHTAYDLCCSAGLGHLQVMSRNAPQSGADSNATATSRLAPPPLLPVHPPPLPMPPPPLPMAVHIGNACAQLPDPGPIGILALQVGPPGRGKAAALGVTRLCSLGEPACFVFPAVGFWKLNVAPVS